uniref:Condensin complex subunit 3 n=1 Tax=Chorthippus mollis TaxID=294301 RepID=A0A3G1II78_9ORTH|nr:condensin complex subunit 3 [Chorthippus mollis]
MVSKTIVSELSVREVFNSAQFSTRNHQTLAKALIQKYNAEGETFCQEFLQCLKIILVQDEKSPVVERSVDFVATFCAAMNDDGEEEMNELLKIVFNFLLEYHEAKNQAVRYRICQMIDKIMNRLGQAELDVNICERITECMLQRLLDKVPSVRAEAVKALYRLQEPEDQDCPIIKAFLFHMGRDPSADVRANVVRIIALNQVTVPYIIKRILDIRETVRCAAYKTLSRINLRSFSIGQRELLLNQGLRDRFDKVKDCVVKELLNTWFTSTNKNFIEFLTVLDVETSTETCTLALNVLFEHQPLSEIINGVPVDSGTHLIPYDKLNPAVSFYWRSVAVHLHKNAGDDLEKMVPELTHYCSYIAGLMKSKERDQWEDHVKEFILKQLLEIVPIFDLSDEAGRANLRQLLLDLLLNDDVQVTLVPVIVTLLCNAIPDTFIRLQTLAEIVSEMHEPLTVVCSEMSVEEKRKMEIKKAELCVKLYEQREIQEEAVKRQDFMEAEAMKPEIQTLEKRIAELTSQPDVQTQEVRQVKNDPFTLTKCLTIVSEMMQSPDVTGLTPQLRSLLDNFVLNNLEVPDVEVLNARIRTLALYSLWDVELAKKYMNLFMFYFNLEVQENEEIYLTVIKAIFDLFVVHGINTFQVDTEIAEVRLKTSKKGAFKTNTSVLDCTNILDTTAAAAVSNGDFMIGNDSCRSLLSKLCGLLNSTAGEVRRVIAEGLCKLLLTGRIASSRILSHLLLVWFNPVTEHDPAVRQMLGCFLETFTSHVPEAAELLEEAFLPVLKVILDAPDDSPLAEVDENEVVSLLINIMKSRGQGNVHNSLAVRLCTEILKHPENYYNKVYLKTLVNLSLSLNDALREDLKNLAEQIRKVVLEKSLINYVKKFEQILERGPELQSKLTSGEVNGNMEHPQGGDLLSLSGGSDADMSEEEGKTVKKTKRTTVATTNKKKKTRKTQSSPLQVAIRDARRALSLDSEDGDFIAEREKDNECSLPVVHEEMLSGNQSKAFPEVFSPQEPQDDVEPDQPDDDDVNDSSKTSKTSRKKASQQQQRKTLESIDSDLNGQKASGRETRASRLKSLEAPISSVTKSQRGRGQGRKAAVNSTSVAMMSVPRKVRTRNAISEQTPQQKPPSPNPDESIAKSRPRRNVKVSVLQTFDDSTDESLATPDSNKKNVVISETSDSEFSCGDDDDDDGASDSDEFPMQRTTRSKKQSKVDKQLQKVQEKFKKLGK